jgi:hypothetical protein
MKCTNCNYPAVVDRKDGTRKCPQCNMVYVPNLTQDELMTRLGHLNPGLEQNQVPGKQNVNFAYPILKALAAMCRMEEEDRRDNWDQPEVADQWKRDAEGLDKLAAKLHDGTVWMQGENPKNPGTWIEDELDQWAALGKQA